jgi:DNA-binding transcriptional MocR family regulator
MDAVAVADAVGDLRAGTGPLYQRVADALLSLAETGVLVSGEQLPSERDLADALSMSRTTVTGAYTRLREIGWIDTSQGRPARIGRRPKMPATMSPAERLDELFPAAKRIIDLSTSSPSAAPIVKKAFADSSVLFDGDLEALTEGSGYAPYGLPELIDAVVDRLRADGIAAERDEIVITGGGQQALSLVADTLAGRGRSCAVEQYSFPGVFDAVTQHGAKPIGLPLDHRGVHVAQATRLCRAAQVDAVFVSRFQNPTGSRFVDEQLQSFANGLHRMGATVVEDRTLADLPLSGDKPTALAAMGSSAQTVTISGVSKVLWGGLRIGWIHTNPTLAAHLRDRRAAHDLGSPTPIQRMATVLLRDHYEATAIWRAEQLRLSFQALSNSIRASKLPWTFHTPDGGPNLWVNIGRPIGARFVEAAAKIGVPIVSGRAFAQQPGAGVDLIRIPFYRSPAELQQAVAMLSEAWDLVAPGTGVRAG